MIVGPKGAGKTLHGRQLAKQMGVFHISFKDRLQELIIAKTKKKIGPEYDDDEEGTGEQAITAPEGLEGIGQYLSAILDFVSFNSCSKMKNY